jgi:putative sigma-54 modulation protein
MEIHFTARHFKARDGLREHAVDSVKKLDRFYDGIVRSDVVLSYEKMNNSIKTAEINLHVHGAVLVAKEHSDDFVVSIDQAVEKLKQQLAKYKTKLHSKNKETLRRVKEESTATSPEEEE